MNDKLFKFHKLVWLQSWVKVVGFISASSTVHVRMKQ